MAGIVTRIDKCKFKPTHQSLGNYRELEIDPYKTLEQEKEIGAKYSKQVYENFRTKSIFYIINVQ